MTLYKESTCVDCGKVRKVKVTDNPKRCHSCANRINATGKGKKNARSFIGTRTEYLRHHRHVWRARGKASKCAFGCIASVYHWANISGSYEDPNDYIELCASCHSLYDKGKLELP